MRSPIDTYVSLVHAKISGLFHLNNGNVLDPDPEVFADELVLAQIASEFTSYNYKNNFDRTVVDKSFEAYPYYLKIDYSELFGSPGWLSFSSRAAISNIIGTACEDTLQMVPCPLVKPPYSSMQDALKLLLLRHNSDLV